MMQKNMKRRAKDEDARDKSWVPGQKGQGGEGLSKGYGGSAGEGTGRDAEFSPSLPSREKIAKVLR